MNNLKGNWGIVNETVGNVTRDSKANNYTLIGSDSLIMVLACSGQKSVGGASFVTTLRLTDTST